MKSKQKVNDWQSLDDSEIEEISSATDLQVNSIEQVFALVAGD